MVHGRGGGRSRWFFLWPNPDIKRSCRGRGQCDWGARSSAYRHAVPRAFSFQSIIFTSTSSSSLAFYAWLHHSYIHMIHVIRMYFWPFYHLPSHGHNFVGGQLQHPMLQCSVNSACISVCLVSSFSCLDTTGVARRGSSLSRAVSCNKFHRIL